MAETTGPKQIGGRFRKGQSSNPQGRPVGARHKATLAAQALLDGEGEAITRAGTARSTSPCRRSKPRRTWPRQPAP